jgi:hypothetical protein
VANLYKIYNGPSPTTAALTPVTTGTAIGRCCSWPCRQRRTAWSSRGACRSTPRRSLAPVKCELIETDVAATVTAHVAAGLVKMNAPALQLASQLTLGTATPPAIRRHGGRHDHGLSADRLPAGDPNRESVRVGMVARP